MRLPTSGAAAMPSRRDHQPVALDDYVLAQPPAYDGAGSARSIRRRSPSRNARPVERKAIPVVADLLKAAAEQFQLRAAAAHQPKSSSSAPMRKVAAASRRRDPRAGGPGLFVRDRRRPAITTCSRASAPRGRRSRAIIHRQSATTSCSPPTPSSSSAEQGPDIRARARCEKGRAALRTAARQAMDRKIAGRPAAWWTAARSVPDEWSQHEKIADTPQGWAMHAMVLDIDVGPLLQTHKLLTSVIFARAKGYNRPLSAAEGLEMMNLTGDGTGLDMVTMPQALREQVPTSNFFQRGGYERNPVAIRHNTVAKLLGVTDARMDSNSNLPGARDLAAAF